MKFKHIKSESIEKLDFGIVKVSNLLNEDSYENLSIDKVEINGDPKFELNKKSDIIDYILEGEGSYIIYGKEIHVKKGDLVFIPKNTKFKHSGKMTLLAISSPKFDRGEVVVFD